MSQATAVGLLNDTLNVRYLERLEHYDGKARTHKNTYLLMGTLSSFLTWLTLLFAIVGLAVQLPEYLIRGLLYGVLPVFGLLVIVATAAQTLFGLQGKWLNYRAGVERLRETCMLFRAKLPPFDKSDAETELERRLAEVEQIAERGTGQEFIERSNWRHFLALFRVPGDVRRSFASTTDMGLTPRMGNDFPTDEQLVLEGRLQHQRAWHLRRARTFLFRYLYFQGSTMAITLGNYLWVYFVGREFWLIAGTTTITLMLFGLRDFFGYGPLFQRYVKIAGNLQEKKEAYEARQEPFDSPDPYVNLARLVKSVEETLSSEFHYWYASRH